MNSEMIMTITTMIVSLVLGIIAKKVPWISNNLIPIQNLIIGIILSVIYYSNISTINLQDISNTILH